MNIKDRKLTEKERADVYASVNKRRKAIAEGKGTYAYEQSDGVQASPAGAVNMSDRGLSAVQQLARESVERRQQKRKDSIKLPESNVLKSAVQSEGMSKFANKKKDGKIGLDVSRIGELKPATVQAAQKDRQYTTGTSQDERAEMLSKKAELNRSEREEALRFLMENPNQIGADASKREVSQRLEALVHPKISAFREGIAEGLGVNSVSKVLDSAGMPIADKDTQDVYAQQAVKHPFASGAGNVVGNLGLMAGTTGAANAAMSGAKIAPRVAKAASNAIGFAGAEAVQSAGDVASGDIGIGRYANRVAAAGAGGAAGTVLRGVVGDTIAKTLMNKGMQTPFMEYVRNLSQNAAFDIGDTAARQLVSNKDDRLSGKDLGVQMATDFAFSLIDSGLETSRMTKQGRVQMEAAVNRARNAYESMLRDSEGISFEEARARANEIKQYTNAARDSINSHYVAGQQTAVNNFNNALDIIDSAMDSYISTYDSTHNPTRLINDGFDFDVEPRGNTDPVIPNDSGSLGTVSDGNGVDSDRNIVVSGESSTPESAQQAANEMINLINNGDFKTRNADVADGFDILSTKGSNSDSETNMDSQDDIYNQLITRAYGSDEGVDYQISRTPDGFMGSAVSNDGSGYAYNTPIYDSIEKAANDLIGRQDSTEQLDSLDNNAPYTDTNSGDAIPFSKNNVIDFPISTLEKRAIRYKGKAKDIFLKAYNSQDIVDYDEGMAAAYTAGRNGKSLGTLTNDDVFMKLYRKTPDALEAIWAAGYSEKNNMVRENGTEYNARKNVGKSSDISNIDNYTEKTYSRYGWAYVNNVLNKQNAAEFFNGIMDIRNGYNVRTSTDGLYIVETASKSNGAKDTIIYTNGNYNNPSVEKVIKINASNETEAEDIKRIIYESEEYQPKEQISLDGTDVGKLERNGFIRSYNISDCPSFSEHQRSDRHRDIRRKSSADTERRDIRRGSSNKTQEDRSRTLNQLKDNVVETKRLRDASMPYSPQDIENAKELLDIADGRKEASKEEVKQAKAKLVLFSHNKDAAAQLGISDAEYNKKLMNWAMYPESVHKLSLRINNDMPLENRWSGLENSSILTAASIISESELSNLVGEIKGDTTGKERNYITRVMLAADTHISYKGLNFEFTDTPVPDRPRVRGEYNSATNTIRVMHNAKHTVAHEMGHYIDALWAAELTGNDKPNGQMLSTNVDMDSIIDESLKYGLVYADYVDDFINEFDDFINRLQQAADKRSDYAQNKAEVFARFFSEFVKWTESKPWDMDYQPDYKTQDAFTEDHFEEFTGLLQSKSWLDSQREERERANNWLTPNSTDDDIKNAIISNNSEASKKELKYATEGIKELLGAQNGTLKTASDGLRSSTERTSMDDGRGDGVLGKRNLRNRGINTIGLGITQEFVKRGYIDFRGRKLSSDPYEAMQELATMCMIFRNPSFETTRVFFTKGRKIVGSSATTSYLINSSNISTKADPFKDVDDKMKRLGADGFYVMHNHPSGEVEPSGADIKMTEYYRRFTKKDAFKGHIIIDHNKYSIIDNKGQVDTNLPTLPVSEDNRKRVIDSPYLYKSVTSPEDVASVAVNIVHSDNYSAIIYADAKGKITAIQEVHNNFVKSIGFEGFVKNRKFDFGASNAFLITLNDDKTAFSQNVESMLRKNLLTDVGYFDSDRGSEMESMLNKYGRPAGVESYAPNGKKYNEIKGYSVGENDIVYKQYRNALKNYTFHMPEGFDGEVKQLGGLGALRREFFGTLNITKEKGVSIDTMYQELSSQNPELFDKDIDNPADQLNEIVEKLRHYRNLKSEEPEPEEEYKPLKEELSDEEVDERLKKLAEKYGIIEKGYKPLKNVTVPKQTSDDKKVRRFVRTVLESGIPTEEMSVEIKKEILNEALSYEAVTDKASQKHAEWVVDKNGIKYGQKEWDAVFNSSKLASKDDIAVGELLLKRYAEANDAEKVLKMTAEIATEATRAGQVVQAMSMLKKLQNNAGPEGGIAGILAIQKEIEKSNRDYRKRFKGKKKIPELKIDEKLAEEYLKAGTEEEREGALGRLYQDLADQVPNTIADKLNQWRYLAMLGNPRTHIRNIVGNAVFMPAIAMKNAIATGLEKGYKGEKSKAIIVDKKYKDFATSDFEEMKYILSGDRKGDVMSQIVQREKAFGNSKIAKPLNILADFNSDMLEKEDLMFLRHHYIRALSMYLQANNVDLNTIKDNQLILSRAQKYAVNEAQKATYRDASAIAATLNKLSKENGTLGFFIESVLPFKKTPVNILKRGIEYTPIGLINGLTRQSIKLRNGEITFNEWADSIASGLTGTAIMALGAYLYYTGVITPSLPDDTDESTMAKLMGRQGYSINVLGYSYTIDWAAPVVIPLMIGAEACAAIMQKKEFQLKDLLSAMGRVSDPMFEMSMLDGLNNTIEAVSYSNNKLSALAFGAVTSYLGQFIPTVLGQIARTIDRTQRINYADKNSPIPSDAVYFIEKIQNKIPFLSFLNEAKLNQWGEENTKSNIFTAAFENFVSPGYVSKLIDDDAVENEIIRINQSDETDEKVTPPTMQKYFGQGEDRIDLTSEQYHDYVEISGRLSYSLLNNMIKTDWYDELSTDEQAKLFGNVYKYSKAVARVEIDDTYVPAEKWIMEAKEAYDDYNIPVESYIMYKVKLSQFSGDERKKEVVDFIKKQKLSKNQSKVLWHIAGYKENSFDDNF